MGNQAGARKADEEDGDGSTAHKGEHATAHDPATCATGTTTLTPQGQHRARHLTGQGLRDTDDTRNKNVKHGIRAGGAPEGGAAAWATRVATAGSRPRSDEARERRISNVTPDGRSERSWRWTTKSPRGEIAGRHHRWSAQQAQGEPEHRRRVSQRWRRQS